MFDYVGDAPVEVVQNLLCRFGQFVFAVVDVVLFQQLKDAHLARIHRMILPAVPDLVAQLHFDIAHYCRRREKKREKVKGDKCQIASKVNDACFSFEMEKKKF